ncbi:MAG: hypothetical protein V9E90_14435 [Saprospiraceae bacterium]
MKSLFLLLAVFIVVACNKDTTNQEVDTEYWEIVSTRVYDTLPPGSENYGVVVEDGAIKARYALNNDEWVFLCNYTSPPKKIRPTDKIPINMEVTILVNSGDQYSANGEFSLLFDRPEVEPCFVIAASFLKTADGVNSRIGLTHRLGVPPSPSSKMIVYLDGKALPTGTPGAQIAFLASVYNGRCSLYKYIYEWKGK